MSAGEVPFRKMSAWLSPQEREEISVLAEAAIWEPGRLGTGYEKSALIPNNAASWIIVRALAELGYPEQFDAWLLRYPAGSEIPPHTDPAPNNMSHIRLNALAVCAADGMLYLEGREMHLEEGDAYVFRPDLTLHQVTAVYKSTRLVLSVGANIEAAQAQALGLDTI